MEPYGPQGTITVARALELPALRRGLPEVLTGADRLDRPVRWVHAGEAPNMAALLKGGELLLTTGHGLLGGRPAEQRAFVRGLAERDIAALVVELGPRLPALPAAVVDTAGSYGLPLVQLHREVPFVAVTEEIHTELVNEHYTLLRQAEEVHRRCTEVLLGGGGVPEVLRLFADFAGNPVFLQGADGRLLYAAGPRGGGAGAADPLQVWDGLRSCGLVGSVVTDIPGRDPGPGAVRARLTVLPVDAPLAPLHRIAAERAAGLLAVVLLQLAMVRSGQVSWEDVVQETLRSQGPTANIPLRYALEDLDTGEGVIPRGEPILLCIAAAGRDPDRHGEDADRFDVTRATRRDHLAFGFGAHHCLGRAMALLEATIALPALFDRFPRLALATPAEELVPLESFLSTGFQALPVLLEPA
ncbi:cytochrome P450 [Streptomyces sp. NPDC049577]|uniref:cytochrome P450 n=1 Tax=Streptomyces sp. NPDC049577 TaxID=3155153 RepID=UPI00343279CC